MIVMANDPANGLTPKEVEMYAKLKAFFSGIVKKLAPPILKEVQASILRLEAKPFTLKRTTRATKKSAPQNTPRATPTENVLLRTLGIVTEDLEVTDTAVQERHVDAWVPTWAEHGILQRGPCLWFESTRWTRKHLN